MSCRFHFQNQENLLHDVTAPAQLANESYIIPTIEDLSPQQFNNLVLKTVGDRRLSAVSKKTFLLDNLAIRNDWTGFESVADLDRFVPFQKILPGLKFLSDYFTPSHFLHQLAQTNWRKKITTDLVYGQSWRTFLLVRVCQQAGVAPDLPLDDLPNHGDGQTAFSDEWVRYIWLNPQKYHWCAKPIERYCCDLAEKIKGLRQEVNAEKLSAVAIESILAEVARVIKEPFPPEENQEHELLYKTYLYQTLKSADEDKGYLNSPLTHLLDQIVDQKITSWLKQIPSYSTNAFYQTKVCDHANYTVRYRCPACGNLGYTLKPTSLFEIKNKGQAILNGFARRRP